MTETLKKKTHHRRSLAALLLLTVLLTLASCAGEDSAAPVSSDKGIQSIAQGENLIIPISEVSETVQFYPVSVDGTDMEILAVKDSGGTVRTAFNTCRICFDSGRGYYKQVGNTLVCQNCGNRFTFDQIEVEISGCNPYPIFSSDKTVTDDSILISYDFLRSSAELFSNWKAD